MQPSEFDWETLDSYVRKLLEPDQNPRFRSLADKEIGKAEIDKVLKEGWKLELGDYGIFTGATVKARKLIGVNKYLNGWERDVTLLHEVIHALDFDTYADLGTYNQETRDNNAIVEWKARNLRANPVILKYLVTAFGLIPQIYDYSSNVAFTKHSPQLMLPIYKKVNMELHHN
jgi:hypothetical protein